MNTTKSTMICYSWGMKNNQNQFQILSQLAFKTRKMELMTFKNNLREILQYTMLSLEMLWLWPCLDYACTQKPQSSKVLSQPGKAFAKKIGPSFWHCPNLQKWSVIQTSMNWKRKRKRKEKTITNNNKTQLYQLKCMRDLDWIKTKKKKPCCFKVFAKDSSLTPT